MARYLTWTWKDVINNPMCVVTVILGEFTIQGRKGREVKHPISKLFIFHNPRKQETISQCWVGVGPPSTTLGQHQASIGSATCKDYVTGLQAIGQASTFMNGKEVPREIVKKHRQRSLQRNSKEASTKKSPEK